VVLEKDTAEGEFSYIDPRQRNIVANVLLFILVFLYVGRAHEAIQGPIRFSLLFTLIGLLFCGSRLLKKFMFYMRNSLCLRRLSIFFVWCIITVPFSRWPGGTVQDLMEFSKVYVFLLLAAVLFASFRSVMTGVFSLVMSILFVLFLSIMAESDTVRVYTITSTYDPNEMAMMAIMVLPLLLYTMRRFGIIGKAFCLIGVGICVVAIALSGSRGGFLGLFAVGAHMLLVYPVSKVKKTLLTALAVCVFLVAIPQDNLTRLTTTLDVEQDYNLTSKHGRIQIWKQNLMKFVKSPIVGVGFGRSRTLEGDERQEGVWKETHNTYIQILVESGIPGFMIFLPIILANWRRLRVLRKSMTKYDENLSIAYGLEGGLWGFLVCITFLSVAYHPITLFYFFLVEAVIKEFYGMYSVKVPRPLSRAQGV